MKSKARVITQVVVHFVAVAGQFVIQRSKEGGTGAARNYVDAVHLMTAAAHKYRAQRPQQHQRQLPMLLLLCMSDCRYIQRSLCCQGFQHVEPVTAALHMLLQVYNKKAV